MSLNIPLVVASPIIIRASDSCNSAISTEPHQTTEPITMLLSHNIGFTLHPFPIIVVNPNISLYGPCIS